MPDAALGALAYLGDLIFGLAGSPRRWQYRPWLVVLTYDEVWSSLLYLHRIWAQTHSPRLVWDAFCGRPSQSRA